MNIQDFTLSNNQKKKIQKAINDDAVLFQEENGDLVVNVAAYVIYKKGIKIPPIEAVVGEDSLDFDAEYFVFS